MAQNADGSATCDRCGIWLEGYGILYGLTCSELSGETVRNLIFCYRNSCRTVLLSGMVNFPQQATGVISCTHCNLALSARSVSAALLATDILPATAGDVQRIMQFCYRNGSRDAFLLPLTRRGWE